MTARLEQAVAMASKLSETEQDFLASRLLAELEDEAEFDRALAASADVLARLSAEALAEYDAGLTEELDPDHL